MAATSTFSVNFANVNTTMPSSVGLPSSARSGVSQKYVVVITAQTGTSLVNQATGGFIGLASDAQKEFTVYAFLQDKITLTAASNWEGITDAIPGVSEALNAVDTAAQAFMGRSTISTWSTRRKWAGSEPISMHMKLRFEAFTDAQREVIIPCIALQGLTLPRGGILNATMLIPPGPNPFNLSNKGGAATERNENISINIGDGFLNFNSVIIKTANVTFENRMSAVGPIGAEVDLVIETYQMPTREDLFKAIKSSAVSFNGIGSVGIGLPNT